MAVLVTRPHPDNEATARALRDRGFEVVLAPMLRFEPVVLADDLGQGHAAVIVTSANAFRAVETQLGPLLKLPLYAIPRPKRASSASPR
jgi:uroporphyrinogen-III synthase